MSELKHYRTKKGHTQSYIAHLCKISRASYANIESGRRRPSPEVAQRIANVLGFDWTEFYQPKGDTK